MSGKSKPQMAPQRLGGVSLIIACEGEKTEPRYFEDLRRALNVRQHSISILRGQGSNPLDVVSHAVKVRLVVRKQGRWNDKTDQAWAVFDGDEHIANDSVRWNQALELARKEEIRIAICNPCIEYWFLLHFEYTAAYLTSEQASRMLSKYISAYDKSQSYVKDHLLARTKTAIANADRVHTLGVKNEFSEYRNPCAHVKDLVQRIWELGSVSPPQLPPLIRENMTEYVASSPLLAGTY